MPSVSEKVIEKINHDKISPIPRWHFLLKNYVVWTGFFVSIGIGSLAFSIILHHANEGEWDIYQYLGKGYGQYIIETIPYLWVGFVFIFLGVAYYNYRHTNSGYRYRAYYIAFSSLALSLVFGYSCYALGIGRSIDEILENKISRYNGVNTYKKQTWSQPDRGLLAGRIIEIRFDDNFDLEDFGGQIWQVRKNKEPIIFRNVIIQPDEMVKVIGHRGGEEEETVFFAKEVRPWTNVKNNSDIRAKKNDD